MIRSSAATAAGGGAVPKARVPRNLRAVVLSGSLITAALLAACGGPSSTGPIQATTPVPTATCPVLNNGPDRPAGSVLYRDPLVDPCGNWERHQLQAPSRQGEPETVQEYEKGGYRVLLAGAAPNVIWTGPDSMLGYTSLVDYRVEVDAQRIGGPDKNFFGVICRVTSRGGRLLGGYAFYIGSDGRYLITSESDTYNYNNTLVEGLDPSAIDGNGVNHIRADCVGTKLALYVNGKKVAEAEDTSSPKGFPGIAVRSIDTPGVDVVFKNFVVTRL
jgi:hypothetical protein